MTEESAADGPDGGACGDDAVAAASASVAAGEDGVTENLANSVATVERGAASQAKD